MDYSNVDVYESLGRLGLERGDVVFVHSNVANFGIPKDGVDILSTFLYAIWGCVGSSGTIVVPTFTYSFPRGEDYVMSASPRQMGVFSERVRGMKDAIRSLDPCYSVAAIGERAYELVGGTRDNSFAEGSFFARFDRVGGKIVNMNVGAGSTFIHYVEREMQVPYRFDKTFTGKIVTELGVINDVSHTIYVRELEPWTVADFEGFDSLARQHGLFKTVKLGRGEIGVITTEATRKLIKATLPSRPLFLTVGERLAVSEQRTPTMSI